MTTGRLFVISAPSGAGKTTLLGGVMEKIGRLKFSVSHTTRDPRSGEVDGVDYHFVSREKFVEMIENGMFIEHAQVHGKLYGTSHASIASQLEDGFDVILDIDVQGAAILRDTPGIEGTFIFIAPPDLQELEKRLRGRGTENEDTIRVRLENAKTEMQSAGDYEYLIINSEVDDATNLLAAIVLAERARAHRLPTGEPIGKVVN